MLFWAPEVPPPPSDLMTRGQVNPMYAIAAIALFLISAAPALATTGGPGSFDHPAPLSAPASATGMPGGLSAVPADGTGSLSSTVGASSGSAFVAAARSLPIDHFALAPTPSSARPLGGTVALPYSTAASDVLTAASGFAGHTWTILIGIGIALAHDETYNTTTLEGAPLGCTLSWIGTQPTTLTFIATPSSATAGTAATYEFELSSTAVPQVDVVAVVVDGTATLLYEESSACAAFDSNAATTHPTTVNTLDSPAAVTIADRAGGSTFLQQNPTAVQEWVSEGATYAITDDSVLITNPPYWIVEYVASCGSFLAEIDGLTGAVLANETSCVSTDSYSVNFNETGLPGGTEWTVELSGSVNQSTTTSIGYTEDNGSYSYTVGDVAGYAPTPASGTEVVRGASVNVSIAFAKKSTYSVTFHETGLPLATYWAVELGNITLDSNTSSLAFVEINGTHDYTVTEFGNWTAAPSGGKAKVTGADVNVVVSFSQPSVYLLNMTESGLPTGTLWGVDMYGGGGAFQNFTSAGSLLFEVPNGTYFYSAGSISPFYNNSVYYGYLEVLGANAAATIVFTARSAYSLTFNETGLPTGDAWVVDISTPVYDLNSSNSASIAFVLPNGSYSFTVGGAPGYNVTPTNGTLVVAGANANATINFTGPVAPVEMFAVTFSQTSLPIGTSWSVTLLGIQNTSTTGSIGFSEPNGSDPYTIGAVDGYQATPDSGSVVVNGLAVTKTIVFTPLSTTPIYQVTFTESGLVSPLSWSVTFAGTTNGSTSDTITFLAANGSFPYTVAAVAGYTISPASGSLTVGGAATGKAITFTATTKAVSKYDVTFTAVNLPSGTAWSVTYNDSTLPSTSSTIVFSEANGTYTFTVGTVSGYTASPASGSVSVTGAAASESITFSSSGTSTPPASHNNASTFLGLPSDEGYAVLAVLVLIVLVIIGAVVWRTQKGRSGPSSSPSSPPPASPPANPPSSP
jgi:hypothetical protein